jgi:hypothetical protein
MWAMMLKFRMCATSIACHSYAAGARAVPFERFSFRGCDPVTGRQTLQIPGRAALGAFIARGYRPTLGKQTEFQRPRAGELRWDSGKSQILKPLRDLRVFRLASEAGLNSGCGQAMGKFKSNRLPGHQRHQEGDCAFAFR